MDEKYKIRPYHHDDDELWTKIGRCFADATIRRELGIAMSSDDDHEWIVITCSGEVAAFGAIRMRKHSTTLRHAYVLPKHRGIGLYTALLSARLRICDESGCVRVTACCTEASHRALQHAGFVDFGMRGKYFTMEYDKILATAEALH